MGIEGSIKNTSILLLPKMSTTPSQSNEAATASNPSFRNLDLFQANSVAEAEEEDLEDAT